MKIAVLTPFVLLVLIGCDSLTKRETDVTIELDTFNLIGTGEPNANGFQLRAVVNGNPACTANETSINSLLAQADNFDDIDEYLDTLELNAIRYRIPTNNTPVEATGSMQMTDPDNGQLVNVASVSIAPGETVNDWTNFPFTDGGAAVASHYLNNRDDSFLYCTEGSPNSTDLSLTLELELDLNVTVDLI